jgi:phage anti-repressor protein
MRELFAPFFGGVKNRCAVLASKPHAGLGVRKDFSDWIKAQVKRAMLTEGLDFLKLPQKGELSATGQARIECLLTLDAAKRIAMLARAAHAAAHPASLLGAKSSPKKASFKSQSIRPALPACYAVTLPQAPHAEPRPLGYERF